MAVETASAVMRTEMRHLWNGRRAGGGAGLRILVAQRRPAGQPLRGERRVQARRDLQPRRPRPADARRGVGRRLDYGYDSLGSLLNRTSNVAADADAAL